MSYCKRCACGFLNVYENAGGNPLRCVKCRRPLGVRTEEVYSGQPEFVDPRRPEIPPEKPAGTPTENPPEKTDPPCAGPDEEGEPGSRPAPEARFAEPQTTPAPPARKVIRHVLVTGGGERFTLCEGANTVGRSGLCAQYLLAFTDVSREHLKITPRSSGVGATLEDVSRFGTWVDGVRVQKNVPMLIHNGCRLRLSTKATLTYLIEEVTQS